MMAQPTSIVIVAALLTNTLSYCSAENVYCVTPTATSCSSCPHNTPCATLSEYALEAELYFTSNTTMVFLPGDHVLDRNITIDNVTRLTMCGESSSDNIATVVRNGSVGFSFTNMVDFTIYSLAFTSYSRTLSYGSQPASNSALFFQSTQNAKLVNCSFHDNIGTALAVHNTNITLTGNSEFIHNQCGCESFSERCNLGCGITALNSNLRFNGNTTFCENNATCYYCFYENIPFYLTYYYGGTGAIWASASSLGFDGTNNFISNSAERDGGAIYAEAGTSLTFNGISTFSYNSAEVYGGAIHVEGYSSSHFLGTSTFSNNTAGYDGGAINAYDSVFTFTGSSSFISNSAEEGGAITAYFNSTLTFGGNVSFTNNTAYSRGGALYLYISSTFSILPHATVRWENNHANLGGAIYVYDANPRIYCNKFISKGDCFFQLPGHNLSHGINSIEMQLFFENNSAEVAGSVLYGGAIDNCKLTNGLESNNSGEVFDMLFQYERDNTNSSISSDPFRICPCENNSPNCTKSSDVLSVYPGNSYRVSVVAVGQRNGIVPANVMSMDRDILPCSQTVQPTTRACTTLSYTVDPKQKVSLELYTDSTCSALVLELNQTKTCSIDSMMFICEQADKKKHGIDHCIYTNGLVEITRELEDTFWVGYNLSACEPDLIVHPYCPFDYCVSHKVTFTLDNTDLQCAHNRTGILCGSCEQGYSLELGTFHCTECTNNYIALVVPFALMGVALVILLLVCKLTVATGTLSGLVFYANIVGANRIIFLPVESTDALSVFIAWLNLDFGIETCFYDGMNAYSKTWLQFVFPVYLWLLVGLMILVSHFSQRFADMLGNNPVSVLATLIFLSYAKILRTLITAVSFTYLEYSKVVWLYDANIEYLSKERIPLLLVVLLVFNFLFFPYTLLLLFGQWLQGISHLRLFSWVNKLKPFTDAYHAPYKANHRYWPGLLLVLRFVILLVLASNTQQDPTNNLLVVLIGAGILQLWAWVSYGVYKNWCLDALEGSFTVNLIILAGATMYINAAYDKSEREGNQLAAGYTSVSIAFAAFIGILSYHIFQQLRHTKLWKKIHKLNMKQRFKKLNKKLKKKLSTKQTEDISLNNLTNDLTESVRFDQLREPLLDDLPQPTHSVV